MTLTALDFDLSKIAKSPSTPTPIDSHLSPGMKIDRVLSILRGKLGEAFEGRVDPAIYVQSVDCGGGKTDAAQKAIANWKAGGFPGRKGIIVAVGTLTEIDAYSTGCKLDTTDYAVVTAHPTYNAFGLGRSQSNDARVLFTTHEQLRRRCTESGSFAATECFYFKGASRNTIIWDEGLVPALPASFDLNDLQALPAALRGHNKRVRDAFEALVPDKPDRVLGRVVVVPYDTARLAQDIALNDKAKLSERSWQTLDAMSKLGGAKAYLGTGKDGDWTLIGTGMPLPSDLPPTFVLDASARLTGNYDHLHRYGFNVVHMPPALVSYANLDIRWWNKGCGKTALANPKDRTSIINVCAALINERPDELWLVVHSKAFGSEVAGATGLPNDLTAELRKPQNVSSVTWGRHLGSNAYRDIANVIVLGSYNYNDAAYEAMHLAFSGSTDGRVTLAERRRREDAEFMHNIYQAVCRSRIRQHVDGGCQPATVYFIMVRGDHRERLVQRAFAGCTISEWQPVVPTKSNKIDLITAMMMKLFETRTVITKAALTEACGGKGKSYLDKVFRTPRFAAFIAANSITVMGTTLYRPKMSKAA
jgi:hypothetical protein